MLAQLKQVMSKDVDIDSYWPEDETFFCFTIQMIIGPVGVEDGQLFEMTVCTPAWIRQQYSGQPAVSGLSMLVVFEYDRVKIRSYIEHLINTCSGESWEAIADKLSRMVQGEFATKHGRCAP